MRHRGVIFDMDGVLVDSYKPHFESWRAMAHARGLEFTDADFAATFGRTSPDIIRQLWGGRFTDEQVAALDVEKEAAYREVIRRDFPEMEGVSDLITALHGAGFRIAIGSSAPRENVTVVHEYLRAGCLINTAISRADVREGKPAPDIFLTAASRMGLEPGQCAVIEDAPVGLEAARRAGMKAIAITGTADRAALVALADVVVDSMHELTPALLAQLIDGGPQHA
jgi:beta-phosphoglucomutase